MHVHSERQCNRRHKNRRSRARHATNDTQAQPDMRQQKPPKTSKSMLKTVVDVFLPVGFPSSVTDDYLRHVAKLRVPRHSN